MAETRSTLDRNRAFVQNGPDNGDLTSAFNPPAHPGSAAKIEEINQFYERSGHRYREPFRHGELNGPTEIQTGEYDLQRAEKIRRLDDPQMAFRYRAVMPTDVSSLDMPTEYIEDVAVNYVTAEALPHHHSNTKAYYPGFTDIPAFDVTFYYDIYARALDWCLDWSNLVHDLNTGLYGLPIDYKRTVILYLEDVQGLSHMKHVYYGCWPTVIASYNVGGENTARLQLVCSFSADGYYKDSVTVGERTSARQGQELFATLL